MRANDLKASLSFKLKPFGKPLLITVFLFGRFMPHGFKDWAIKRSYSAKIKWKHING